MNRAGSRQLPCFWTGLFRGASGFSLQRCTTLSRHTSSSERLYSCKLPLLILLRGCQRLHPGPWSGSDPGAHKAASSFHAFALISAEMKTKQSPGGSQICNQNPGVCPVFFLVIRYSLRQPGWEWSHLTEGVGRLAVSSGLVGHLKKREASTSSECFISPGTDEMNHALEVSVFLHWLHRRSLNGNVELDAGLRDSWSLVRCIFWYLKCCLSHVLEHLMFRVL